MPQKATNVAVVAGGTAGVGRATVARLIEDGYCVAILARGRDRLDKLSERYGDRVVCLPCDVSRPDQVARAGAAAQGALGPVDLWVNAAMLTSFSPFLSMKSGEFDRIVNTTLMGVVNGTRTALSLMQGRNRGAIVNIGSGLAYRSVPYQSAYCASKHAINGFSASLRSELIREGSGIRLSLVQLPAINTPQFDWALNRLSRQPRPAPPVFSADVAARAVMRAVHAGGREYFVGRSVLQLVFGNMVVPAWLDRKMADSGAEMQKSETSEPGGRPHNLDSPVHGVAATSHGRFDQQASDRAIIVDADRARLAVFCGLPAVVFFLGLMLG